MTLRSIIFGSTDGAFGFLSTSSPHPTRMYGRMWPTVEHYVQARKAASPLLEEQIRNASTASAAVHLGRSMTLRPDWTQPLHRTSGEDRWGSLITCVSDQVLWQILAAKYTQHLSLKAQLLETGTALLVEDAVVQRSLDYIDTNKVGRMLMHLRDRFSEL